MILTATTAAALSAAAPATAAPKRAEAPAAAATSFAKAMDRATAQAEAYVAENQARIATTYWGCVATVMAAPKPAFMHAYGLTTLSAFAEVFVRPGRVIFTKLVDELDAVRTTDPALRGARAVWHEALEVAETMPDGIDGCAKVERWKAAGWSEAARPALPEVDAAAGAAISTTEAEERRTERRVRAAVRRLRALGVAPKVAGRFDPEVFRDILQAAMPQPLAEAEDEDGAGAEIVTVTG